MFLSSLVLYISFCKSSFFKKYHGIFHQYYICVNIISLPLELKAYTEAALFHCAPSRFHFNYLLDGFLIFTLFQNLKFLYNSNEKCKLLVYLVWLEEGIHHPGGDRRGFWHYFREKLLEVFFGTIEFTFRVSKWASISEIEDL